MFEFLAETYAPYEAPSAAASLEGLALAADQVTQAGAEVRLQRTIYVPEDDTCFYLFQAASADAVREAMTRAGLRPDRITQAVSTETNQPAFAKGQTHDPPG
jgi:hypothetical protein